MLHDTTSIHYSQHVSYSRNILLDKTLALSLHYKLNNFAHSSIDQHRLYVIINTEQKNRGRKFCP